MDHDGSNSGSDDGAVRIIQSNSEAYVNRWIYQYLPNPEPNHDPRLVVGLHIELRNPQDPHPYVAAIAVCIRRRVLVFHMYQTVTLPIFLRIFMTTSNNTFVGFNLGRRLQALRYWDEYDSIRLGHIRYRNLGALAARRLNREGLRGADVRELAHAVLGIRPVMPPVNPNWDRMVLLNEQVVHASRMAHVASEMGRALLN